MKFGKYIAVFLLAMSLGFTMLTGCSKPQEKASNDNKATTTTEDSTSKTDEKKDNDAKATNQTIVLKAITREGTDPSKDSKVYQSLKEKLNIELDVIETTEDNRQEKVNILLATGDIPDLFFASVNPTSDEVQKWIKQDLIVTYDDYLSSYPNIKTQLEKFNKLTNLTKGKYYMLPIQRQIGDYEYVNDHTFWVRSDYLKNLGKELPKTFEEFNDLLYALTNDDPDKNGTKDTFGLTIDNAWWLYGIYNMFGASEKYFYEDNGEWKAEAISDNMKNAITYINKLYKDGVLDPEFMIQKSGRVYENFISGKAGMMFKNGGIHYNQVYNQFKDAYQDKDPKELFTWVPITTGVNGQKPRLDGGANYWGATYIGNTGDEQKITKSLELIDYLASDEGKDLFFYGIEGVHYVQEGDTKKSLIPDLQKVFDFDKHGNIGHLANWLDGLFPESVMNREECKESYQASMEAVNGDPLVYTDLSIDATVKKTLKEYTREGLAQIVISNGNLDKQWEEFIAGWYKAGGTQMTKAVNEAVK